MDLHCTASAAPVRDAELPPAVAGSVKLPPAAAVEPASAGKPSYPHPDAEVRMAERQREEAALEALEAEITWLWGHINAATAHFLALLAEFDRREGWAQHGIASCAHWLSWQCGIGPVAAREKVRVARALTSLPKIAEAFGEGRLSYSKVRALTRVATAETEDTLLNIALNGTPAWRPRWASYCSRRWKRRTRSSRSGSEMRRAAGRPRLMRMRMRFLQMFPRKHPGRTRHCRRVGMRALKMFPRKHLRKARKRLRN